MVNKKYLKMNEKTKHLKLIDKEMPKSENEPEAPTIDIKEVQKLVEYAKKEGWI